MAKISTKRQITLPVDQCELAGINLGDDVSTYVDRRGIISIVKKSTGAAKGALKGILANKGVSDDESLMSTVSQ